MALGGGIFTAQNKVLPGTYINFVSASDASSALSERGVAAMALELDWGTDGEVFAVTAEEFRTNAAKYFGYDYGHDKMKGLRDLFRNIRTGYFFKLMNNGVAASNEFCTARCKGLRGNALNIVIAANVDDPTKMDVSTFLDSKLVDKQTVLPNTDNLVNTDWVIWESNVELTTTAGAPLTSGDNGEAVTNAEYQAALDQFEAYRFNTLGCLATTSGIVNLVVEYTKRMRDERGIKFQAVVYQAVNADHEGVISVENTVLDAGALASALVYWVTGAEAGCEVNKSVANKRYDGEFTPETNYTQAELEAALQSGKFIFHRVGDTVRVLEDINTFVSVSSQKSSDFSGNQTIRVIDQVANDIASLFSTKYLGSIPNNASGRVSLWADIVAHHQQLQAIGAIEGFDPEQVMVSEGENKKAVVVNDVITPMYAMGQVYMTVVVS